MNGNGGCTKMKSEIIRCLYIKSTRLTKQYSPDVVALDKGVDEDDDTAEPSIKKIAILILDCNFVATQPTEVPNF